MKRYKQSQWSKILFSAKSSNQFTAKCIVSNQLNRGTGIVKIHSCKQFLLLYIAECYTLVNIIHLSKLVNIFPHLKRDSSCIRVKNNFNDTSFLDGSGVRGARRIKATIVGIQIVSPVVVIWTVYFETLHCFQPNHQIPSVEQFHLIPFCWSCWKSGSIPGSFIDFGGNLIVGWQRDIGTTKLRIPRHSLNTINFTTKYGVQLALTAVRAVWSGSNRNLLSTSLLRFHPILLPRTLLFWNNPGYDQNTLDFDQWSILLR